MKLKNASTLAALGVLGLMAQAAHADEAPTMKIGAGVDYTSGKYGIAMGDYTSLSSSTLHDNYIAASLEYTNDATRLIVGVRYNHGRWLDAP